MSISAPAYRVLRIGLPLILIEFIVFAGMLWEKRASNAAYALYRYPVLLEHIMMGLTILVIGAFLFDYIAKSNT